MKPKILLVVPYPFLPATTGGELCTLHFMEYLSQQTSLDCFTVDPYTAAYQHQVRHSRVHFKMRFSPFRYLSPFVFFRLLRFAKSGNYTHIIFEQPWMGWMMFLLKLIGFHVQFRAHNIEYTRFQSVGKRWWPLLKAYETWTMHIAHRVLFLSEPDRQFAIQHMGISGDKTLLVPFGVTENKVPIKSAQTAERIRKQYALTPDTHVLLFFSTLNYKPNSDAVHAILTEIIPRLNQTSFDYHILICGKHLSDTYVQACAQEKKLTYCGFVPDISEYIDAADIMLNPILSGGGVKTKAMEVLGRNGRVLSTQTGAQGINPNVCGEHLQIVPDGDWDAFTQTLIQLVSQTQTPDIPLAFYETYNWDAIIRRLLQSN